MEDTQLQEEVIRSSLLEEDEIEDILRSLSNLEDLDKLLKNFAHKDMILEFNTQTEKERDMAKGAYYRMVHLIKRIRAARDSLTE